ncbi:MAG TPA: YgiT-type zinc finger protein [Blastocatellia bacterium]|nr:YgiT-type zinc finger protein [Blastocatellia bacterium]
MSDKQSSYDSCICHVCGEQMREQEINQDFWIKGNLIVIESVPAGVCPQCGEKVVNAQVGQRIAALLANLNQLPQEKTIKVPVISFAQKVA